MLHHGAILDPMDYGRAFTGGQLTDLRVDIERGTVAFVVRVIEATGHRIYDALLSGVTEVRIRNKIPVPWNYAEIDDFSLSEADQGLEVGIVLWGDPNGITAICSDFEAVLRQDD